MQMKPKNVLSEIQMKRRLMDTLLEAFAQQELVTRLQCGIWITALKFSLRLEIARWMRQETVWKQTLIRRPTFVAIALQLWALLPITTLSFASKKKFARIRRKKGLLMVSLYLNQLNIKSLIIYWNVKQMPRFRRNRWNSICSTTFAFLIWPWKTRRSL